MLIAFQYFDNIFSHGMSFIGILWWTETHERKHQRDEDGNTEERVQIRPICNVPKVCVNHWRREEKRNPRQRYRGRSESPPSSDRRGRQISCAQSEFFRLTLAMILLIVVRFFIRANTDVLSTEIQDRRKWR